MTSLMLATLWSTIMARKGCSQCRIWSASQPTRLLMARRWCAFSCEVTSMRVKIFVAMCLWESCSSVGTMSGCLSSQERLPEKYSTCCFAFLTRRLLLMLVLVGYSFFSRNASRLFSGMNW